MNTPVISSQIHIFLAERTRRVCWTNENVSHRPTFSYSHSNICDITVDLVTQFDFYYR